MRHDVRNGSQVALDYAHSMAADLQDALAYWGSVDEPSAKVIADMLRRWLADLEDKGAILVRNRFIIDVVPTR